MCDIDLKNTVYALDASTIDLYLAVFLRAPFRSSNGGGLKLHTLSDLRGNIPSFLHISNGTLHDINLLDLAVPEPEAFYVMDRVSVDSERLHRLHEAGSFFVTHANPTSMPGRARCKQPHARHQFQTSHVRLKAAVHHHDTLTTRRYTAIVTLRKNNEHSLQTYPPGHETYLSHDAWESKTGKDKDGEAATVCRLNEKFQYGLTGIAGPLVPEGGHCRMC